MKNSTMLLIWRGRRVAGLLSLGAGEYGYSDYRPGPRSARQRR